ncbi:MDR family MFS transporter [Pseudomonas gingeri]|uniref:Multidrug efflux MFS transporter n=2 Tax=Pseudomonas gingeri TaxID=117681 RepID=A0A7Y7Y9T7_9PSED|nr:MDR family MFS transporter [Pseudomonas gingeri]NWA01704.1 multidrug efflux MFS transporter [Pseudomonas gingeri]NWA12803.1 multidrug efflux MFS transporter [Pseudomonas gingeri]NWA57545.1 multidrug efflux MFS transporter [Pseudomonas gingeri]NWA93174.1 multidrug efflux MFS transporter [Pseudomonas gingeri]NWB03466.1 multidrug efflux MFS transporter [Pseudomonas gingeri]
MADSAPVAATPEPAPEANASVTDWIAVAAGALGALLATLDISITNSALPQIQGQIGASGTEGTWISTGYLMSEIVMIPLAAWLTRVFGLRRFLMGTAMTFTLFSFFCGMSTSLTGMILARVGQGFAGGAMIPTAQTIIGTRLPRHQMAIGMSMFGLIVLLGPLLGPVLGGWLTENASWRWCFFLNLPISLALVTLLWTGIRPERADFQQFIKADWLGILGLALGLSALTVILEEGQREHWFESSLIVGLSLLMLLGFILVAFGQFSAPKPIVKLELMRNPRYASVILIVSTVGAAVYGVSYLLPQFLGSISGYNAQQSGSIMLLSGIPAFLLMPFLPRLMQRYDSRWLVSTGLVLFVISCMMSLNLTVDSVGHDFDASQLVRGFAQILAMMPLNQLSMAAVQVHEKGEAAGLYNMSRNIGGSIGLALTGVLIDRRNSYHDAMIRESLTANSTLGQEHMAAQAAAFMGQTGDQAQAQLQTIGQLSRDIALQASVITFSDCFYLLGIALALCIPLAFFLKKPPLPVSPAR